ncbi:hypothetical protein [uncultured Thalassospira sp.]|uniref:hypothetical protein n=1 Tax=uncultured Thalassospira sp. TaxID=404382 RepID=UPI00258BDF0E|nr:hypothetical protein [uncultured Thalassospira sp.]
MNSNKLLDWGLWSCAAYFCCMATAHFFGIKVPLLFVYYDTLFYAYQDKIISFAIVAYIALFYSAARVREVVPAALVTLWLTAAGLTHVNLSDALAGLEGNKSMTAYWAQTAMIGGIAIVLTALFLRSRKGTL